MISLFLNEVDVTNIFISISTYYIDITNYPRNLIVRLSDWLDSPD